MDAAPESQTLQDIVAQAYRVFRVKPPRDLSVCTDGCCMPADAERRALEAGQSNISLHDLREWQHAAFEPENGRAAVRWVLPRTLELLADGEELNTVDPSLTLKRLALTGFPDGYRPEEVDCLNAFAVSYVKHLVNQKAAQQTDFLLDDVLCMFANAGVQLSSVLEALDSCSTIGLIHGLSNGGYAHEIGFTVFWDDPDQRSCAVSWYCSERLEHRMIDAALDPDLPDAIRQSAERIADDIALRSSD